MRLVRRSLVVGLSLIGSLIGTAHADGDALVDALGPREVAMGEALRASATGASAIGMNPAGLPLNRELVFEGGYGYRISDEASILGVSACDSTNAAPGCFYYSYAANDMHRTHVAGMSLAYPITPRVALGSSLKYFNFKSDIMTEPKASGFTNDLGMTLRLTDLVNVGVAGYNLLGKESTEFNRAVGTGVMARPIPTLSVSFDARWKLEDNDHTMRYGGGAELFMRTGNGQTGFPLRAGALHDNGLDATFVSAGGGIATMKFAVDVAARFAVSGPEATTIIASLRFFGPRLAAPSTDGTQ
ncbi:MAG TPA: hypothetical protein VMZ53_17580 [Kofleriaceae bacterium]|nr:hypothetical protein [Kofleriaceae bacterium]